jgi:hypothetical protein
MRLGRRWFTGLDTTLRCLEAQGLFLGTPEVVDDLQHHESGSFLAVESGL